MLEPLRLLLKLIKLIGTSAHLAITLLWAVLIDELIDNLGT